MIEPVDRPLVYIAGPYSSDPLGGTRRAISVAERLESTGIIAPHIPHLNILWDFMHTHTNEFWYAMDLAILNRSDALFRMTGQSPGADNEVQFAEDHSIEVFYEIDDLIAWAEAFVTAQ